MSYAMTDKVFKLPLPPSEKLVLLALAWRLNEKTGDCFPSVACISRDTGLQPTAIKKAIRRLEHLSIIRVRRERRDGLHVPNRYTFNIPADTTQLREALEEAKNGRKKGLKSERVPSVERGSYLLSRLDASDDECLRATSRLSFADPDSTDACSTSLDGRQVTPDDSHQTTEVARQTTPDQGRQTTTNKEESNKEENTEDRQHVADAIAFRPQFSASFVDHRPRASIERPPVIGRAGHEAAGWPCDDDGEPLPPPPGADGPTLDAWYRARRVAQERLALEGGRRQTVRLLTRDTLGQLRSLRAKQELTCP